MSRKGKKQKEMTAMMTEVLQSTTKLAHTNPSRKKLKLHLTISEPEDLEEFDEEAAKVKIIEDMKTEKQEQIRLAKERMK